MNLKGNESKRKLDELICDSFPFFFLFTFAHLLLD